MPEICEVEKLTLLLVKCWTGRRVSEIRPTEGQQGTKYFKGDWDYFETFLIKSEEISQVKRRGKHILVFLGSQDLAWHIHLGSTGWFKPFNDLAWKEMVPQWDISEFFIHQVNDQNTRTTFVFDDGQEWNYHDPRTWGKWEIIDPDAEYWRKLGPDWIHDREGAIRALTETIHNKAVKDVLTDQHITAGLGFYMSNEIMFLAKIHPETRWGKISKAERAKIGEIAGAFVDQTTSRERRQWAVFKRKGQKCVNQPNHKIVYEQRLPGSRGSYLCPTCQPRQQ